jgi:hypothetical protein
MTDAEQEERAVWKLAQGGEQVRRQGDTYLVTSADQAEEIEDLAQLIAFAEAVYDRVWTGRKITPSA